ncbi:MAG: hypothetical protein JW860_16100 [Sedimentisphaerales bacterium]|nr:hypothetical protein [Sedimentisphaerales bacterium]
MLKTCISQKYQVLFYIAATLSIFLYNISFAQTGGDYTLTWSTMDSGGGSSSGGPYLLMGTIGQPDTGQMNKSDYEIQGGFWPGWPLCIVDMADFANFAQNWLANGPDFPADLDESGSVNLTDMQIFAWYWLDFCPDNWRL